MKKAFLSFVFVVIMSTVAFAQIGEKEKISSLITDYIRNMNIAIKSQDKTKVLNFVTEDFFSIGDGRISINSKAGFSKSLDSQIESAALNPTDGFFAKVKSIIKVDISTNAASVIALIVTKAKEGESRIEEKNVLATFYLVKQNGTWKISNEHCSTSK